MRLHDLCQAIISSIGAALPALKAVEAHPGRINSDELKRLITRLPAVRVAVLSSPSCDPVDTGQVEINLRLAAFVITGDRNGLSRDEAALAIVEALAIHIPMQRWGMVGVSDATKVKADNLYSGMIDRQGVSLWAVGWEQSIRTGTDVWGGGSVPSEIYASDNEPDWGDAPKYMRVA
jgi:phage gp37-like protein